MKSLLRATAFVTLVACKRDAPSAPDTGATPTASASASATSSELGLPTAAAKTVADRKPTEPPPSGTRVDVAGGSFACGSAQGDEGRDPAVEPMLADVRLEGFAIDALPFPNDPGLPPKVGLTHAEAAKACNDRGARLCTELEWERACKGPNNDTYATGPAWDEACDKAPSRCASGFGVRGIGFLREWTEEGTVFRGGPGRRCAARRETKGSFSDVGFRCCSGARNPTPVPPIGEAKPAFRRAKIDEKELAKIFEKMPELARLGRDIRFFKDDEAKAITNRPNAPPHDGITFVTTPLYWSPEQGVEVLVATGRGKTTSFVVALWTLPKDDYRFASAFFLLNDTAPVALAYEPSRRKELRWSACWGCTGEQGAVSYRDDHRIVVVQH